MLNEAVLNTIVGGFDIVAGVPGNVEADLGVMTADISHINSIVSTGGPIVVSAATFESDQAALNKVVGGFVISDTAANVAAAFDELNSDVEIDSIALTDSGAPILALTSSQFASDTRAVREIVNPNYVVTAFTVGTSTIDVANFHGVGGTVSISSGAVNLANGADATVSGSDNTITMNANGTVTASGTNNLYVFGSGGGQGVVGAAGGANTGTVDFGSGLTDENLWFQQSGANLQIDVMGITNSLTIDDWFGGTNAAAVQGFATTDGLKLDTQVGQLVSAMATYAADNSGFNPTLVSQVPTDTTLQSAVAAAWHH